MPRRNSNYNSTNRHSTPRSRRRGLSAFGLLIFSVVLGCLFAFGAALTGTIAHTSGAPMTIAYGLLAIAGACFIGGLSLTLITAKLR